MRGVTRDAYWSSVHGFVGELVSQRGGQMVRPLGCLQMRMQPRFPRFQYPVNHSVFRLPLAVRAVVLQRQGHRPGWAPALSRHRSLLMWALNCRQHSMHLGAPALFRAKVQDGHSLYGKWRIERASHWILQMKEVGRATARQLADWQAKKRLEDFGASRQMRWAEPDLMLLLLSDLFVQTLDREPRGNAHGSLG